MKMSATDPFIEGNWRSSLEKLQSKLSKTQASSEDYVIKRLYASSLGDVVTDLVFAGLDTRMQCPLARQYPIHVRKTIIPTVKGEYMQDPQAEYRATTRAAAIVENPFHPLPIGYTEDTYRSRLIPGYTWANWSLIETGKNTCRHADQKYYKNQNLPYDDNAKLYMKALSALADQIADLHKKGYVHNDLHRSNIIFVKDLGELVPVMLDFEYFREMPRDNPAAADIRMKSDYQVLVSELEVLQHHWPIEYDNLKEILHYFGKSPKPEHTLNTSHAH